jgi:P-type Cu2+ transporter
MINTCPPALGFTIPLIVAVTTALAADIVLVRSNPLDMVTILDLSRVAYRKTIQNRMSFGCATISGAGCYPD